VLSKAQHCHNGAKVLQTSGLYYIVLVSYMIIKLRHQLVSEECKSPASRFDLDMTMNCRRGRACA